MKPSENRSHTEIRNNSLKAVKRKVVIESAGQLAHTLHLPSIFKISAHLLGTKKLAVQLIIRLLELEVVRWRDSPGGFYTNETRGMEAILGSVNPIQVGG